MAQAKEPGMKGGAKNGDSNRLISLDLKCIHFKATIVA